jgi:restriction system protein
MRAEYRSQDQSMAKQRNPGEVGASSSNRSAKATDVLSATAAENMLAISGLSQHEVERLVAQAYRRQGYEVVDLAGSDAGQLLTKATQRLLLQCKHWKARQLAEMPVRELYGMMAEQNANAGILITSGSFTLEASRFAGYGSIQLIDGPRLLALLREDAAAEQSAQHAPRVNSAAR